MAKILITGGAGFLGSQVGFYLHNKGHEVKLLDNLSYGYKENLIIENKQFGEFIEEDIRNKNISKYFQDVDYVIHLAGISSLPTCQENVGLAFDINVAGTANILELCRMNNVKKVFFSSTSAVYENNSIFPLEEDQSLSPDLTYSLTKKHAEEVCQAYSKLYNLNVVIGRFFNLYGPHQDFKRKSPPFISYMLKCLYNNETPIFFSNGEQERDYVYIQDACTFIESSLITNTSPGEVFNCCSGIAYSTKKLYKISSTLMEKEIVADFKPSKDIWDKYKTLYQSDYPLKKDRIEQEVNKFCVGSPRKSKLVLNWEAQTKIQDGIKATIEFITLNNV